MPYYDMMIAMHPKNSYGYVYCSICNRTVHSYKSLSQAISNWNRNRKVNKCQVQ